MTLALTALRLQAIAALNSDPVIAAACSGRVYDSRLGDFDDREPVPVILVTTEELEGDAYSANNGGVPFNDVCNLVLEIGMNAVADDGAGNQGIWAPAIDSRLEAATDLLAWAAEEILTVGVTPEATLLRSAVTRRVSRRTSSRFVTDQTGEKLAIRLVTFRVALKGSEEEDPLAPATGPFASLPDPLRTVCESLQTGSAGSATCAILAAAVTAPSPLTLFTGIDITAAPRPEIDPAAVPTEEDPIPNVFITANTAPSS